MNNLPLTIGLSQSPITQALFDGSVRPNGIDLKLQTRFGDGLDNVGARHRAIIAGEIDGGELSISSYILARTAGFSIAPLPPALHVLPDWFTTEAPVRVGRKKGHGASLQRDHAGVAQRDLTKRIRRQT
jgi:hypothetical protein